MRDLADRAKVPAESPVQRRIVAAMGGAAKNYGPDDPRTVLLRRELGVEGLAERIEAAAAAAPPLTGAQRARLTALLNPGPAGDAG